jgi:hypothetical protein
VTGERASVPRAFDDIVRELSSARVRGDVTLVETPAPSRIAPFAVALNGEIRSDGSIAGTGRFVVLHDPAGQDAWEGDFRIVALVQAQVEPEVGRDDAWSEVAWSWVRDALSGVPHRALGGTVTRTVNEAFGNLSDHGATVVVEMRVSWTPIDPGIAAHLDAWIEMLASFAGVPPLPEGVAAFPGRGPTT